MCTKLNILITKILNEKTLAKIKAPNISIKMKSFIKIVPLYPNIENIKSDNIIMTSPNSLYSLASHDVLKNKNIYCVGKKTKKALEELNINVLKCSENAKDLSNILIGAIKDACFICSNIRLSTLPDILHKNNINIDEIQAYKTILTPHLVNQNIFNYIIFFSPSGVNSFFKFNCPNKNVKYIAIGNTTASQIRHYVKDYSNIVVSKNNSITNKLVYLNKKNCN